MMIKKFIQLNGESYSTAAASVVDLLKELSLSLAAVLVEQNGVALLQHELQKAPLREGDRIEILKVVAGG